MKFDASKHVVPKYTIDDFNIGPTEQLNGRTLDTNSSTLKMPLNWPGPGFVVDPKAVKTKKALDQARSEQKLPHISYDLDGDGQVS